MPDVFISYSRADIEFVRRLHGALVARSKDVWVDWEDIPLSAEWLEEVFAGIESSDNFVFVISPDSLSSEVCGRELGHAVEQHKRVVPILRRDPDGREVPAAIAARNWTFFRADDAFARSLDALVAALDTDLEWVREHTRLLGRALEWEQETRDGSFLLRGRDLEEAERWIASQSAEREPRPTALQMEYVLASRRAATRRQRVVVGAALVAVLVASALALLAWTARNDAVAQRKRAVRQARLALSRQLAAQAVAALDVDPERGLVLAARAATRAGTVEARDALRLALRVSRVRRIIEAGAPVRDVAFRPDGGVIAAALGDGRLRIWAARTGRAVATVRLGSTQLRSVSFSRDGRLLLSAGPAGAAVWALAGETPRLRSRFDRAGQPVSAAIAPDGSLVATGDRDGVVRLWRAQTGTLTRVLRPPGERRPVFAVAFGRGGSLLAAATGSRTVMWTLPGAVRPVVRNEEQQVWALAVSPDGRRLATGETTGGVRVWDLRRGTATAFSGHEEAITDLAFSPDGRALVSSSEDETARIWASDTRAPPTELRGHDDLVLSATFAPDGKTVATGGADGTVRLWAATPDAVGAVLAAPNTKTVRAVAFGPSGRVLLAGGEDLEGRIWDVSRRRVLEVLRHGTGANDWVEAAALSHDGRIAVTAGDDGKARLWSATTGRLLATLERPGGAEIYDTALSPDGRVLATAGRGGVVELWQWRDGRVERRLTLRAERIDGVAFSHDGRLLAAAGGDAVRIWRVDDGARVASLAARATAAAPEQLMSVAYDPRGGLVAAVGTSGALWLWDVRTGHLLEHFVAHDDSASSVAFSADGRYLVTSGAEGMAKVWTVPGGHLVTLARPGARSLEAAVFAPGGRAVAVAGDGGRVTIFDCEECQPLHRLVCLAATRIPGLDARKEPAFRTCD